MHMCAQTKTHLQNPPFNHLTRSINEAQSQQISFMNINTHTCINNEAWRCSFLPLLCSHVRGSAILLESETKATSFTVHGHAHKHINTQMYASEPGHKLINTYVTQMRKRPLRDGWGNVLLSHINTSVHLL